MRLQCAIFELDGALLTPAGDGSGSPAEPQLRPGAEKFLSLLKMEDVWMYAVSPADRTVAEAALRRTGLSGYFRGLMTYAEAGCGGEDPVLYEKCLTRLRCAKPQCVVFASSLSGLRTAKQAGFRVAAVCSEQPEAGRLADYEISSYEEWLSSDGE